MVGDQSARFCTFQCFSLDETRENISNWLWKRTFSLIIKVTAGLCGLKRNAALPQNGVIGKETQSIRRNPGASALEKVFRRLKLGSSASIGSHDFHAVSVPVLRIDFSYLTSAFVKSKTQFRERVDRGSLVREELTQSCTVKLTRSLVKGFCPGVNLIDKGFQLRVLLDVFT